MMLKTGRLLYHDPQSLNYEHWRRTIQQRSVTHRIDAPALDQNGYSACTGFAAAQWLNCRATVANRKLYNYFRDGNATRYLDKNSGLGLYIQPTREDEFPWAHPPADEGS